MILFFFKYSFLYLLSIFVTNRKVLFVTQKQLLVLWHIISLWQNSLVWNLGCLLCYQCLLDGDIFQKIHSIHRQMVYAKVTPPVMLPGMSNWFTYITILDCGYSELDIAWLRRGQLFHLLIPNVRSNMQQTLIHWVMQMAVGSKVSVFKSLHKYTVLYLST